ncbi:acetyl-CoA carboxylase biotin carboxyl carrier protein [Halalkalibacter nanhaiisediminis]|uniref:Biotin carboxyl carrier protein of acetyl-CoA carboxylase n=1 Tax=Halalkalibacter nanhaiisediminis TaxID=688079 RepID=A0A562QKF0_9BACI|nr:acetyl-CoA carboxylase biotin carboxyl carrier protein [Halalkalibacter nanhaiisediminis]TWI57237.1 acetyl-CoA carboxylase biotin carboxyl carrier protein [Halalkalibacter nanhaiisediminis]
MLNVQELKEIIRALDQSSIQTFQLKQGSFKITLEKAATHTDLNKGIEEHSFKVAETKPSISVEEKVQVSNDQPKENNTSVPSENEVDIHFVHSPMVGTFYTSPDPGADNFVKVGDQISEDTVVCIIEAMKLFNEIEAEASGEVVEILAENGQLVEYGQPLLKVRKR